MSGTTNERGEAPVLEIQGLKTYFHTEDGLVKAAQGLTSFEEIIRTLPRLDRPRPLAELNRLLGVRR